MRVWDELPECMRCDAVRPYYEYLRKKRVSLLLKRAGDLFLAGVLILVLSPVLAVIGVWIKSDSEGPVFFKQERVTTYGSTFWIYKFRTMVVNADKLGTQVTTKEDARITKVGAKIRKYRLDELPQLFNILRGEMTFVGTRPEVPKYVAAYTPEMTATLLLPAGVTSRASIEYKDEDRLLENAADADTVYIREILPEKMRYNLNEIKDFSLLSDIKTMFATVAAVIR